MALTSDENSLEFKKNNSLANFIFDTDRLYEGKLEEEIKKEIHKRYGLTPLKIHTESGFLDVNYFGMKKYVDCCFFFSLPLNFPVYDDSFEIWHDSKLCDEDLDKHGYTKIIDDSEKYSLCHNEDGSVELRIFFKKSETTYK